jgi:hypothetical protein
LAEKSGKPTSKRSSAPPPSSAAQPPTTSSAPYALGAVVLAAAIAVLLYGRCSKDETKPTTPATTAEPSASGPAADLPEYSPPPPPEDAGVDDADGGTKPAGSGVAKSAGGGMCAECGKGVATSALTSAVQRTAGLAHGCYQRALRQGGSEGMLMVSVRVGPDGSVCGASITKDTLNNPGVSQCVLGKFTSRTYPKPQEGCVIINVPINFQVASAQPRN